ncbi:HlyC/CorC family transporter [Polynucleobacter sp. MWH-Spelu-300-X4]|uniref:HlyC/CorC family transporter n=1 Tax=Polynucleobacter sp. MWH-Spelu-300-X4 TaxID=2689109 RepID=UPI001BFE7A01|nr:HlyC/CorC family transporter [Polynucleobacter sp. MWH-Spelu-300-X4]QWD79981.1 HlyC/CorC family transporter [Polynucleobacter sp. MWH-Spelu-300-X4]
MDSWLNDWPWWAQFALVVILLAVSAFFSITETSMMAANRHRIRHLANRGHRGAKHTQELLGKTEALLSVILIGNNLVNTIVPVLLTGIALHAFGNNGSVLSISTGIAAVLIIIFCEITPKVIGATYPERISIVTSWIIRPLIVILKPVTWLINVFVTLLLKLFRVNTAANKNTQMSPEELRSVVLESTHFIPNKHRSILVNLFNLENIQVDDVMTPRSRMEVLDLSRPIEEVIHQLETCYHNKLPVCEEDSDKVIGILAVRKALSLLGDEELTHANFKDLLSEPYFIPSGTPVLQQLQYFQENQERVGLVVDEYGIVQGLVTIEDILEELIGEFTTSIPDLAIKTKWSNEGDYLADGSASLRDLNRTLGLNLSLEGPKTLNGLLLETLEDIPDNDVSVKINDVVMEIIQVDEHTIKTVRIYKPNA